MKPKFGEPPKDRNTKAAHIRALFVGGRTISVHTQVCMNDAVWNEAENAAAALREHRAEVRAALSAFTDDGIPWAGKTTVLEGDAPIWRQVEFWSEADFLYNYEAYKKLSGENIAVANKLAAYCEAMFGRSPKRLAIVEVEDEPC